jgi:hypothetical protein
VPDELWLFVLACWIAACVVLLILAPTPQLSATERIAAVPAIAVVAAVGVMLTAAYTAMLGGMLIAAGAVALYVYDRGITGPERVAIVAVIPPVAFFVWIAFLWVWDVAES